MEYKTIDLCAGIGGIRRGFEMSGKYSNVLSAEIDPSACETYKHLFGEDPQNDLTTEEFKKLVSKTEYDVLLAGFPCQAFSSAGLKLGFRDTTRGTIFFDLADIISRTNPRAVFLENVENLYSHDKGKTLKTIISTLEGELGYRVIGVSLDENGEYEYTRKSFIRNSRNFGVPQNRPRMYIMAFSKKIYGNGVKSLTDMLPERGNTIVFQDLNAVLEPVVDDVYYMSEGYWETLKKHKARQKKNGNGFGYQIVNAVGIQNPCANTIMATGGSGKERNLIYQPKAGVAGKKLKTKQTVLNSEGIRVMTPLEWGRLQGFIGYGFIDQNGVDTFSFPVGTARAQQYKQFGNSVTIPVIKEMAEFMSACFDKMNSVQMVKIVELVKASDSITIRDIIELLNVSKKRAEELLKWLIESKILILKPKTKTKYQLNSKMHP